MKNTFSLKLKMSLSIILIIFLVACKKDKNDALTPCTVENKGIYYQNSGQSVYCDIDSVILTNRVFKIWFSDNGINEHYKAELYRHDGEALQSGMHYFVTNPNESNAFGYPSINFTVDELSNNSNNTLFLFDKFEVCLSVNNDNQKMGVLIEGMKVANSTRGHSFLTFSLENEDYIAK